MKELIFVYGTLKRDGSNFFTIKRAGGVFKCKALTLPYYNLISFGGFPGLKTGAECKFRISGELFEITDISPIDILEGYPTFYGRRKISVVGIVKPKVRHQRAWAYFINDPLFIDLKEGVKEKNGVQWWENK